jgi:flagellar P-ring protein precursor FlgI
MLTNLKGLDDQVYVVAQGKVVVGAADGSAPKVTTVARVTQGGIIEREFSPNLSTDGTMLMSLIEPDFTTSLRASDAINEYLSGPFSQAKDPASVSLLVPERYIGKEVELMAEIENLLLEVDRKATVVINERTGTIVMGDDVKIGKVSISHGGLSIQVKSEKGKDGTSQSVIPVGGTSVGDLVKSLNQMGVKPKDLISIIQALHASGAMSADLRIL